MSETGRPGANSWAASQALEAHPEAVLDLIEMLFTEGRKTRPNEKLVSAYVYMIGQALEFIRIARRTDKRRPKSWLMLSGLPCCRRGHPGWSNPSCS